MVEWFCVSVLLPHKNHGYFTYDLQGQPHTFFSVNTVPVNDSIEHSLSLKCLLIALSLKVSFSIWWVTAAVLLSLKQILSSFFTP